MPQFSANRHTVAGLHSSSVASPRPSRTFSVRAAYAAIPSCARLNGSAVGLYAASYDGRPIKIEGNPAHPDSLGAAAAYHQATVLGLYDPDRSENVISRAGGAHKTSSWPAFSKALGEISGALRPNGGAGLRVLAERSSSPTLAEQKRRLLATFPQAKWGEIVKKMVKVYGAPIAADEEPPLVEYLVSIRSK